MLEFRRVLAFSSRIHTYLMVLYLFFAGLMFISFFTPMAPDLVSLVSACMAVISWVVVFEGVWIILASVYQLFYSRVFAFAPVLLTLLRGVVVIFVATIVDTMQLVVSGGVWT